MIFCMHVFFSKNVLLDLFRMTFIQSFRSLWFNFEKCIVLHGIFTVFAVPEPIARWCMMPNIHLFTWTSNNRGTDSLNQTEWLAWFLVGLAVPNHLTKCHYMCFLVLGLNCGAVRLMDEIASRKVRKKKRTMFFP